jgi:hypothetical protein
MGKPAACPLPFLGIRVWEAFEGKSSNKVSTFYWFKSNVLSFNFDPFLLFVGIIHD